MKGETYIEHSNKQGIYILQPNTVNGEKYWINKEGHFAIWCVVKGSSKWSKWVLGLRENIGKSLASIASPDDVADPKEVTTWKYWDGKDWKTQTGDLIVTGIPNSEIVKPTGN
jgi:hypothetical protein